MSLNHLDPNPVGAPCVMVIFGASGDLTKRKLIPALCNLASDGLLSKQFAIVGFAGPSLTLVHYAAQARDGVAFAPARAGTELRPQLVFGANFAVGSSPRLALVPELTLALGESHYDLERGLDLLARASDLALEQRDRRQVHGLRQLLRAHFVEPRFERQIPQ